MTLPSTFHATEIVKLCERELEKSGLVERKSTTLWRRTNLKFNILKVDIIPRARCEKWRVPSGSFGLEPSCLFPFLPRRGGYAPKDTLRPEKGFGQVRLSLRRRISQPCVNATNIWWPGDNASVFDSVVTDVLGTVSEKVVPFFNRFEDAEELLRTFLEDAIGREGVWEFGKKGSPIRLLYTGFAAIECSEWDLALQSLRACEERTKAIDATGDIQKEILPYVDQGLDCARHRRTWSLM